MAFIGQFLDGFTPARAALFAAIGLLLWLPSLRQGLPARLAMTLSALAVARYGGFHNDALPIRLALFAVAAISAALGRRPAKNADRSIGLSAGARLDLALASAFAAASWSALLLAIGAAGAAMLAIAAVLRRRWAGLDRLLARAAGESEPDPLPARAPSGSALAWTLAGLAVLAVAITVLELRQPYYFCQDDMLVGETPGLLQSMRDLWNGSIPQWNAGVFMGVPVASAGGRIFYPPQWLAYAIARGLLHNELAQVDVAAVLHLAFGYLALAWVLRRLGCGGATSAAGALSVALSGPLLVMGRCWAMFIYGAAWMPLLMYAVVRLARGPVGVRWVVLTGAGIGLVFQIGFVQLWATALLFMGLAAAMLWLGGRLPTRRLGWLAVGLLLGIALSAPLMYEQWRLTRDLHVGDRADTGVIGGLLSMLLPYPLARADHPLGWGGLDSRYMGEFYYFGTTFALLALLGCAAVVTRPPGRRGRDSGYGNVWLGLALLALLLALGADGGAWRVMSALPVLSIVNHYPFRLLPMVALFAVMGGAVVATRLLGATRRGRRWEAAGAIATMGLLLWGSGFARSSFYEYGFRPTQSLPAPLASLLGAGARHPAARVMGWAPMRSSTSEFRNTLALNLPMLDGLIAFNGYDPLTESREGWKRFAEAMNDDPLIACKIYGVRWCLVSRLVAHPVLSAGPAEATLEHTVPLGKGLIELGRLRPPPPAALRLADVTVYDLATFRPDLGPVNSLAFVAGRPSEPLAVTVRPAGIDVDLRSAAGARSVVVNWRWQPPMRADAGGAALPCRADEWGRILVDLPAGASASELHVRYVPDWGVALSIGAGLALAAALGVALMKRVDAALAPTPPGVRLLARGLEARRRRNANRDRPYPVRDPVEVPLPVRGTL